MLQSYPRLLVLLLQPALGSGPQVTWAEPFLLPIQHHQGSSVFIARLNIGLFCTCLDTVLLGEGEMRAVAHVLVPPLVLSACPGLHEEATLLWGGRGACSPDKNLLVLAQHPVISCLKLSFSLCLPLSPVANPMLGGGWPKPGLLGS